jgi:spore maturation protein CgeB
MKRRLAGTPLHGVWRRFRERQLLRRFDAFCDAELGAAQPGGAVPAGAVVDLTGGTVAARQRLQQRAGARCAWPDRPRIVGFGTTEWEQHGLWPSLEEVADFSLWQYRQPFAGPPAPDDAWRRDLADRFLRHLDGLAADGPVHGVFFYASANHIASALVTELQRRGIWTLVMGLDDKHQFLPPPDAPAQLSRQLALAVHCDLYWTTWPAAARIVAARGGNPWYAGEGAHPDYYRPVDVPRDIDAVFIGAAYGARGDLVRYLRRRGLDVQAFGSGWPGGFVSFDEMVALYSRARVVLGFGGVGHTADIMHLKGRDFEVPMCGAVYLTTYNPELAHHFDIGREILCYRSPQECAELLRAVLADPDGAARMRAAVLDRCRRDHTWRARLEQISGMLHAAAGVGR